MISNLFFEGKIKQLENTIIFEEDFVSFLLKEKLQESFEFHKEDVEKILEEFYGKNDIKNNKIESICSQNFISRGDKYVLELQDKEDYQEVREMKKSILQQFQYDNHTIYNSLFNYIFSENQNADELMEKMLLLKNREIYQEEKLTYLVMFKLWKIKKEYYKIYRNIDYLLEKIPNLFNRVSIHKIGLDDLTIKILISHNIFTIQNLKKLKIESIIILCCNDIERFYEILQKYSYDKQELILQILQNLKNSLKENEIFVLTERYKGIEKIEYKTLEEIGKNLNITKQRVRQIESKGKRKLQEFLTENGIIIESLYYDTQKLPRKFLELKEYYESLNNDEFFRISLAIFEQEQSPIRIDYHYNILYDSSVCTIEDIVQDEKEKIPNVVSMEETTNYNSIRKKILWNEYKKMKDNIYLKKGMNVRDLYLNVISEIFPSGYSIGSEDDYHKLTSYMKEKYGDIGGFSSMRAIQGMIERSDFIQVDRGMYRPRKYGSRLPDELLIDIIEFMSKNRPVISYQLIYEKFQERLNKLGIQNRYYLKGLLDEKIPDDFIKGRDFIKSDTNYSAYDLIVEVMRKFPGEFSLQDIKLQMPGLKNYVYENYAMQEQKNGLIRVSTKHYIYIDKLKIDEKTKKELEICIDQLFEKMNTKVLTVKKIYMELNILHKEILEKLHITARFGDFELFSIIQCLWKEKYFYSRPFISKEETENVTNYSLIKQYVQQFDQFNYEDVKRYVQKMNMGILYSYLSFMEDLSEEYVQINIDTMRKIEHFEITEDQLNQIDHLIELILKNQKEINTNNFDGYFMLPKLKINWNQYLLVGIIRSYFSNKYKVENTNKMYHNTDFKIRRSN